MKKRIVGHQEIWKRFAFAYSHGRLANTFLFVGADGIGKRSFAIALAKTLLCSNLDDQFTACDRCASCVHSDSQTHPDLILIRKPDDKNFIPVESFVGDREHRRREGMCHDISLTPFHGKRKIAIIDDADFLNAEGANCLLKVLEEPPADSILILIGTSEHRQLPTILSRCQIVRFQSLSKSDLIAVLDSQQRAGELPLEALVAIAGGSVARAMALDSKELHSFRSLLLNQLATLDPGQENFAATLGSFVEAASKDSAMKRERLRLIAEFAVELFRATIHVAVDSQLAGELSDESIELSRRIIDSHNDPADVAETMSASIDRTLQLQRDVDANLSLANIIPSWLNDLGAIARRDERILANW